MKKPIQEFIMAKNNVLEFFNCKENYFIKPLMPHTWSIKTEDGVAFLSYWSDGSEEVKVVVAKKDGKPLIFETRDYTMVIGIECIKIAFVFKNMNKL